MTAQHSIIWRFSRASFLSRNEADLAIWGAKIQIILLKFRELQHNLESRLEVLQKRTRLFSRKVESKDYSIQNYRLLSKKAAIFYVPGSFDGRLLVGNWIRRLLDSLPQVRGAPGVGERLCADQGLALR